MNDYVKIMRNFYNLAIERYRDADYALMVTALNFSMNREKVVQILGLN